MKHIVDVGAGKLVNVVILRTGNTLAAIKHAHLPYQRYRGTRDQ